MSHHKHFTLGILWVLVLLLQSSKSFGWFFSSGDNGKRSSELPKTSDDIVAEFSMELLNSEKGLELVEKAKRKAALPNSCWQNAYQNLFAGCSEILAGEEQRSRLAWHLSDCFQKDTGRPPFPYCDEKSLMVDCLKRLDKGPHSIYLEFYLETNTICHQLQTDAFKRQTERLVNELKKTAESAENKLENIEEQAERLLHNSDHIHHSLSSIDVQTQELAQTSKNVEEHVTVVLEHSQSVYEQSLKIADSQLELGNRQINMNERLDEGMTMLNESANKLGEEMNNLRNEAVEIEKEVGKVGDAMFKKMDTVQNKADDIENIAETSLNRQKQLLESQSSALEILQTVTTFQSQALEESRGTLQKLIELGHNQQQELIQRQEQLKQAHDHLVQNSKTILAAQETFESKQASMFLALEKLFSLHNAILLESRLIKAFLVYCILIFTLYMFTSTKQTYSVRSRLYIGLCVTFLIELLVLRYGKDIEQQAWIISIGRLIFVLLASCQLLYAIYTYRDYESLNHQMLQSLIEKVNGMQGNKQLLYDDGESDVDWSSWIDTDITEDELEDLDYMLPEAVKEGSITTSGSREYSLRNRRRR
ncbi:protein gamete expressed 1 isoform X1 [Tanacetum coccineum]|uniref:Protein gamete expressed 1 isoform X1 n=1 Tax=Tanacetum coccineum TaxID=301880 RepID=A0ABQ5AQR0_9ASTR